MNHVHFTLHITKAKLFYIEYAGEKVPETAGTNIGHKKEQGKKRNTADSQYNSQIVSFNFVVIIFFPFSGVQRKQKNFIPWLNAI